MIPYKEIPLEKKYFTIGQVAEMFNVATSLIRFWETEFPIRPHGKYKNGSRRYDQSDIAEVKKVYDLVKVRGFTLQGAKDELKKKEKLEIKLMMEELDNPDAKKSFREMVVYMTSETDDEIVDNYTETLLDIAKGEACAFAEWLAEEGYSKRMVWTSNTTSGISEYWVQGSKLEKYTTPELWDKWKQK